jgi:hypothetical protein
VTRFWEIIIDDSRLTFEITGSSSDVALFTNNVEEMQSIGMKVRCQTPEISIPKNKLAIEGYKWRFRANWASNSAGKCTTHSAVNWSPYSAANCAA